MITCKFYGWKAYNYYDRLTTEHHPMVEYIQERQRKFPNNFSWTRNIKNRNKGNFIGKLLDRTILGVNLDLVNIKNADIIHVNNTILVNKAKLPQIFSFDHLIPIPPVVGPYYEHSAKILTRWYTKIPHLKLQMKLIERCLKLNSSLVTNSKASTKTVLDYFDLDPDSLTTIYYSIKDFKDIDSIQRKRKKKINDGEPISLLFIGSDFFRKGGLTVLKSLKKIVEGNSRFKLSIITYKNDKTVSLLSRFKEKYPQIEVKYNVDITEINRYYQESDIYLCPTLAEAGIGYTIIDASNYALPVISTNIHAVPEGVIHNKTGFLIQPMDWKKLAENILFLIENEDERKKMGINGREFVMKNFSQKKINKQYYDLYTKVISRNF